MPYDTIRLSDIAAGTGGFKISGASGLAGHDASFIGDVNGDGIDDIGLGGPWHSGGGHFWAIFGSETPPTAVDLRQIEAGNGGFALLPGAGNSVLGRGATALGDVNGDGFDDFSLSDDGAGQVYVVFGHAGPWATGSISAIAAGNGGYVLNAEAGQPLLGMHGAVGIGDINGDGIGDLATMGWKTQNGDQTTYVVYGRANDATPVDLADVAAGRGGYAITVPQGSYSGIGSGDFDGDGKRDLLLGAALEDSGGTDSGGTYIIWDASAIHASSDVATLVRDGQATHFIGENAGDHAGNNRLGNIGDINGDGIQDLVVDAYANDAGGSDAGAAYVIFGGFGRPQSINLDAIAAGQGGFKIIGEHAGNQLGLWGEIGAADLNGDGLSDIVLGSRYADGTGAGYVVWGKADTAAVNLDDIARGVGGFKIVGEPGSRWSGHTIATGGDFNHDGASDIVISAIFSDAAYVIYGQPNVPGQSITGTTGDDSLAGAAGNDTIAGLAGDDTLAGAAGDDSLYGGNGGDSVDGGGGEDTILGANGNDTLAGGDGDDSAVGNAGDDALAGGAGNDPLRGAEGRDEVDGGAGNDRLFGGSGDDTISGGDGNDTLVGGDGIDEMSGGAGHDVFVLAADADAGTPAPADVLFEDHFSSSTLSAAWESPLPRQRVENGWLHTQDSDGWPRDSIAVVHDGDSAWTDYTVSMTADFADGSPWENFTILLRSDGFVRGSGVSEGTAYQLTFNGEDGWDPANRNTVELLRTDNETGQSTRLFRGTVALSDDPMDLQISLDGGRIRLAIDGKAIFDVTDADPLLFGGIGVHAIWESEARFDNIIVTAGGAPAAGEERITDFTPGQDRIDLRAFHIPSYDALAGLLDPHAGDTLLRLSDIGGRDVQLAGVNILELSEHDFLL